MRYRNLENVHAQAHTHIHRHTPLPFSSPLDLSSRSHEDSKNPTNILLQTWSCDPKCSHGHMLSLFNVSQPETKEQARKLCSNLQKQKIHCNAFWHDWVLLQKNFRGCTFQRLSKQWVGRQDKQLSKGRTQLTKRSICQLTRRQQNRSITPKPFVEPRCQFH